MGGITVVLALAAGAAKVFLWVRERAVRCLARRQAKLANEDLEAERVERRLDLAEQGLVRQEEEEKREETRVQQKEVRLRRVWERLDMGEMLSEG